jgi:hypothetical protein
MLERLTLSKISREGKTSYGLREANFSLGGL